LTIKEDWQIMEMQSAEIKEFISYKIDLKPGFTIVKATKIENFSKPVRDLIYELSVFEKMENQCEITEEWLIRDFKSIERKIFDEKTFVEDRFYDLYMQWTVLGWNTEAIDFYTKYKSKNLTELYGTHFFRMLRETIYA